MMNAAHSKQNYTLLAQHAKDMLQFSELIKELMILFECDPSSMDGLNLLIKDLKEINKDYRYGITKTSRGKLEGNVHLSPMVNFFERQFNMQHLQVLYNNPDLNDRLTYFRSNYVDKGNIVNPTRLRFFWQRRREPEFIPDVEQPNERTRLLAPAPT